ncbi:hypothetical protein, partial [Brucella inopinata]
QEDCNGADQNAQTGMGVTARHRLCPSEKPSIATSKDRDHQKQNPSKKIDGFVSSLSPPFGGLFRIGRTMETAGSPRSFDDRIKPYFVIKPVCC